MKESFRRKLDSLKVRSGELEAQLSDSGVIANQSRFRDLSKEYAELEPVVQNYARFLTVSDELQQAQEMLEELAERPAEAELRAMAEEEVERASAELEALEAALNRLLLPTDARDDRNVFLEIRAGAGGDEAAIFSGDLFRMYSRYVEAQGWKLEVIASRPGEHGGYKEIIARIEGRNVYARLKFESGAHRVQRVPETEAQGRIHTSACTVAVMPEVAAVDAVEVNRNDLRIDTFRASGAGGQHVNKTDSAIRITHIPTGMVVECQDERSQHQNRARAIALLQARLLDRAQAAQQQQQTDTRRRLVGSGDRSEKIRTYNFPQGRITDHRIKLTLYNLPDVMAGNLETLIEPLSSEHQADLLAGLTTES